MRRAFGPFFISIMTLEIVISNVDMKHNLFKKVLEMKKLKLLAGAVSLPVAAGVAYRSYKKAELLKAYMHEETTLISEARLYIESSAEYMAVPRITSLDNDILRAQESHKVHFPRSSLHVDLIHEVFDMLKASESGPKLDGLNEMEKRMLESWPT